MSKYTSQLINELKNLQLIELIDAKKQFDDYLVFTTIQKKRILNRMRKKNISEDISSFEKYITQEINSVIYKMPQYDVRARFSKIINQNPIYLCNPELICIGLYNNYYVVYCYIRTIFIAKSKEMSYCIKYNELCYNDILQWRSTFKTLKQLFKDFLIQYDNVEQYFRKKIVNMMLINDCTRNDFCLESLSSFEDDEIIVRLKQVNKISIVNIILSFVDWNKTTFESYARQILD
jgi:hypothetical protein